MTDIVKRAEEFSKAAHAGQVRKYDGTPYHLHPQAVAALVRTVRHTPEMLAAAFLHDVVEDTGVPIEDIERDFGRDIAMLVWWLTDVSRPSDGNRAQRKAIDREHTADAPPDAKTVKLADLIDNSRSIQKHDPKFAKVYMREKQALLLAPLVGGDRHLYDQAQAIVTDYFRNEET